jgi:hypothetical protein
MRDARMIRALAAGAGIEDVAAQESISPKRARERVSLYLARRAADAPAELLQLQIKRLSEAMTVAYAAMSGGNLKAVDRVVRITREFDRYYGFTASLEAAAPAARPPQSRPLALSPPLVPTPVLTALTATAEELEAKERS